MVCIRLHFIINNSPNPHLKLCSNYYSDFERRAIKATGEIQEVIGCGVSFHPGRNCEAPHEIMRLYLEAGGKANKCVMSHLEREL